MINLSPFNAFMMCTVSYGGGCMMRILSLTPGLRRRYNRARPLCTLFALRLRLLGCRREEPRKVNNAAAVTAAAASAKCGGSNYPPPPRSSLRWSECTFCCKVAEAAVALRGHMTIIRYGHTGIFEGLLGEKEERI